jgi:hypothetical protein
MFRVRRQVPANLVLASGCVTFAASQTNRANRALCVTRNEMRSWSGKFTLVRAAAIPAGESPERHHWLFGREGPWLCSRSRRSCLLLFREFSYAPYIRAAGRWGLVKEHHHSSLDAAGSVLVFRGVKNNTKRPSSLQIAQCITCDFVLGMDEHFRRFRAFLIEPLVKYFAAVYNANWLYGTAFKGWNYGKDFTRN